MAGSAAVKLARRSDAHVAVASRANEPPAGAQANRPRPELRRLRPSGAQAGAGSVRARPSTVPARSVPEVLRCSGEPLPAPVKQEMGARFGTDFSQVRVHADAAARASAAGLGARAYTSGSHIVIGDGGADKRILAHELSHVIQQRQGPVAGTDHGHGFKVSDPADRDEQAAQADAQRVLSGPAPARPLLTPDERSPSGAGATAGVHVQRARTVGRRKKRGGASRRHARLNIRGNGTVSGISGLPGRPSSSLRGKQGQHRTAYVVFEKAVINRVKDRKPGQAADELMELVEEYKNLPGMAQANARYLDEGFEQTEEILTEASKSNDADAVGEAISLILQIRNQVPGTAEQGTGGGHGEAGWAAIIEVVESDLRSGGLPTGSIDAVVGDQVRQAMWHLLAYSPSPPQGDTSKEEAISKALLTHYLEMRNTWPFTWDWLNEKKYWLVDYLLAHRTEKDMPLARLSASDINTAIGAVYAKL